VRCPNHTRRSSGVAAAGAGDETTVLVVSGCVGAVGVRAETAGVGCCEVVVSTATSGLANWGRRCC
jgi:hypothetical protein